VGLAFDVDNLAKFMAPEEEPHKICILATPNSHAFAEAYRTELESEVVDIQYEIINESIYHKIYQVVERSEERRVGKESRYTRSKRDWSSDVCSSDLVGLAFDVDNLAKFMAPEEEPHKICILATPNSHAFAEAYRTELESEVVDIQYEIINESIYHKIYQVVE